MIRFFIFLFLCLTISSCKKVDNNPPQSNSDKPNVEELPPVSFRLDGVDEVGYFGAKIRFTITEGTRGVSSRGVAYGVNDAPTVDDGRVLASNVSGSGTFEAKLTGLLAGRKYFVRPFVERNDGITYGNQIDFSTVKYPTPTVYLDSTTFHTQGKFQEHWNMFYPWGTDHNGSARMYAKQVDLLEAGVLRIHADRTEVWEGYSTADPWLRIFYHSGAIHAKQQILVDDEKPYWVISGDFKVPTMVGSWPAFWITGVNSWPPEIDIMEFKGNNTNWQNTVTGPNWQNTSWQTTKTIVEDAGDWHNYKLVMYKQSSKDVTAELYIDEQQKAVHVGDFVGKPFWLIINMQMEGASGGHASGPQYAEMQARNVYLAAFDVIP